ncbi:amidohydrolase family protein [Streptomyces sp. SID8382]|uniref:amidohydrolase family protein n=1 Tax=Streptomyces malaysiensis TaxID=92644 RepID=UPI000C2CBF27|nr:MULTISPECIES: amidohydrolase family protein [unclassified Streptomyces]AUA08079.1 Amidohydrolase [Streptomyces sp. M56]MYX54750.1 amidohydrolase family protein [Streptomyces sp. SID8382]
MKLYGLEEHFVTADVIEAWKRRDPQLAEPMMKWAVASEITPALLDLDSGRVAAMDDAGIDVSVLSLTTPGLQNLDKAEAVALQAPTNDAIAAAVRRHPDRFQGFAALATPAPSAAAAELRRAVTELGLNGMLVNANSGGRALDAPEFWEIYEAAEDLRVPVYLHPSVPFPAVTKAYYRGFSGSVDSMLATGAFGWHYDAGLTALRMIIGGVFDRFPGLQLVLGHWGEVVLFYLDRIAAMDKLTDLRRPIAEYFRSNIFITPGGISSHKYLRWSLETVGIERIMYASDYPFNREHTGSARHFLETAPIGGADRKRIAYRNWEKLVAGIRR